MTEPLVERLEELGVALIGYRCGRLPFFLRRWWLRDHAGGETFPSFGSALHTLPLGSQYSHPVCDVGSSDIRLF